MHAIVPERLIALREAAGLSQEALAELAGVGQSTIQRLEAGATRNPRNVFDLALALKTTPQYLLGQGDEPTSIEPAEGKKASDRRLAFRGFKPEEEDEDSVLLDQVDLRYGMGASFLDGTPDSRKRKFSREWLRSISKSPAEMLFWATGDGDSMEPTIRSGEVVLIDRSQITPRSGDGIWAFAWGDIGQIKRLRPLPSGALEILSDNPFVPPATAVDGEVNIIGRVVAVVRRL